MAESMVNEEQYLSPLLKMVLSRRPIDVHGSLSDLSSSYLISLNFYHILQHSIFLKEKTSLTYSYQIVPSESNFNINSGQLKSEGKKELSIL